MAGQRPAPFLLDTQLLIWLAFDPQHVPAEWIKPLEDRRRPVLVSVVSLWEVAIKRSLNRDDFRFDGLELRRQLQQQGFEELPIRAEHCLAVQHMSWHHRDPFDRLLIAQAQIDGLTLLSCDQTLSRYGTMVQVIKR